MNGGQGFLDGGGNEEGGAEGTVFTNTVDDGMRGGGRGREAAGVGSSMCRQFFTLGILG